MSKHQVYEEEFKKLSKIFEEVEESKRKLVEGLIQDAAFLYAENYELKKSLSETGMIKFHPKDLSLQKNIPAGKEFRQNLNSYSVVIKTLNSILQKVESDEDDLDDYE